MKQFQNYVTMPVGSEIYGLTNWKYPQAPRNIIFTTAEFLISSYLVLTLHLSHTSGIN
jgi:hypothetical protein